MPPAVPKLAILGVGLIGASLAAALKRAGSIGQIAGYSPGDDARVARALGYVDVACDSVAEAVTGAGFVVVAAPVTAMPTLFAQIRDALDAQAIITDCGSTKRSVIDAARRALGDAFMRYVPGHPIAGSERSGPQAADPDLFRGRRWLLCPLDATPQQHCEAVARLLEPTGAQVSTLDPSLHDRIFAEASHWPHAVAFGLSAAIAGGDLAERALEFSGAGLRDTTRVGASSPTMWADILLDNRDACLASAARFRACNDAIVAALETGDREALVALFSTASRWRNRLG
ncbi:MAG TPA: prephenate dehydrogenase/arogenate dehydrogenase family protein [Burkholderiaceae bacterium]|nr:prephenate dehydrogenase/arogenate dehydrogenase family protein [Burkholderiaceae bacterium]HRA78490.1 prephenate dehydrogenase/arogenate dehydrogenase family protein [Burkholderiaceae bacterium]